MLLGKRLKTAGSIGDLRIVLDSTESVMLTTADLDGDSVGALVALHDLLTQLAPSHQIEIVLESPLPRRYMFLLPKGIDVRIGRVNEDWSQALAILVDSEPSRFRFLGDSFAGASKRGLIDHHQTTDVTPFDFVLYDAKSPSTTTLIYQLYQTAQLTPSLVAAQGLYAGLVFDTSIFRYKLTSPSSLRMAADLVELGIDHASIVERLLLVQQLDRVLLRAKVLSGLKRRFNGQFCLSALSHAEVGDVDSGGLVDDLIFIAGVDVAALIIELSDGRTRISLRSRCEVDVASVARSLHPSGGGHVRSAGVTLRMGLDDSIDALSKKLGQQLKAKSDSGIQR